VGRKDLILDLPFHLVKRVDSVGKRKNVKGGKEIKKKGGKKERGRDERGRAHLYSQLPEKTERKRVQGNHKLPEGKGGGGREGSRQSPT